MENRFCWFQQAQLHILPLPLWTFWRSFLTHKSFWKTYGLSHSPDLSPYDFFLWGDVKGKVLIHNPISIKELKVNITKVIHSIDVQMLQNVYQNLLKRAEASQEYGGGERFEHLLYLLFYFDFILFSGFWNIAFSINPLSFFWDTLYK